MVKTYYTSGITKLDRAGEQHLKAISETNPMPQGVCSICGLREWWYRRGSFSDGGWVCGRCHPKPGVN